MNKNKLYIIIIFCTLLTVLTGCGNKNEIDNSKLKNLEQVNILDIKYMTLYEKLSGIQLTKQRVSIKNNQANEQKDNLSISKKDAQENQEVKEENLVETTRIIYDSNLLNESNQPDWDASKELCYEIQNISLDIQSQMIKNNYIDTAKEFEGIFNQLINSIVKEDKNKSVRYLAQLYDYILYYIGTNIDDNNIYNIKDIYYDSICSLIYLENDDKQEYKIKIEELKQNSDKISEKITDKNVKYLINKINILIDGINDEYAEDEKENIRLKLVMLIKSISSIDTYIQKVDNYGKM